MRLNKTQQIQEINEQHDIERLKHEIVICTTSYESHTFFTNLQID
jgi:hypothetical protein